MNEEWKDIKGFEGMQMKKYKIKIKNPIMGVPITFLDKYNPEQFEIIGYTAKDMGVDCLKFYEDLEQSLDGKPFVRNMKSARFSPMIRYDIKPNKTCYRASNVKGYMLKTYGRILIRKKAGA